MSVLSKFNSSVNRAVKEGRLDRRKHGATIEAARKLAELMDRPDWPIVGKSIDNVSPSTFLKYCLALNLVPAEDKQKQKTADNTQILKVTGNSKWKRA